MDRSRTGTEQPYQNYAIFALKPYNGTPVVYRFLCILDLRRPQCKLPCSAEEAGLEHWSQSYLEYSAVRT
eukprot:scaffold1978_cov381-Prasinococcus_capsulatus_cf.AAC.6